MLKYRVSTTLIDYILNIYSYYPKKCIILLNVIHYKGV